MRQNILKPILILIASFFIFAQASAKSKIKTLTLGKLVPEESEFVFHRGEKAMESYVAMNLPHSPFAKLKTDLEKALGLSLKDRGESHITVISPVEFDSLLSKRMKIEKLNSIALLNHIQKADLKFLCIGRGQKMKPEGGSMETYFVVLDSKKLRDIRNKVGEEYVRAGGAESKFLQDLYFPHITLGFTDRDLHLEDGVKKDSASCLKEIKLKVK